MGDFVESELEHILADIADTMPLNRFFSAGWQSLFSLSGADSAV